MSEIQRLLVLEVRTEMMPELQNRMSGHASIFGATARIGPHWERIATRAFDGALSRPDDVRCLLNHNPDNLLGRTSSGTLQLNRTATGLQVTNELPDTTLGRDVRELIRRGDLNGMSFGFRPTEDEWSYAPDGRQMRTITDLDLFDVSLATFPAYADTNDVVLRTVDFSKIPAAESIRSQMIRARSRLQKGKG